MNVSRICSAVKMTGRKQSSTLTGCQKNALVNLCQGPFPWEKMEDGREGIQKTFHFADFNQAFSFMQRTALLAEKIDHHPEWFNVYNVVEVKLTTHDTGGISSKDIEMARRMDEYASALLPFQIPEEPVEVPLSEVVVEKTTSSK